MFYDKLLQLCELHGISPSVVAESIGLNKSSATYWKRGALPKIGTVQKIANYFQIPITFFLQDEEEIRAVENEAKEAYPNDQKEQEYFKMLVTEGSISRQYLSQLKKVIECSNKVILQKASKITDYALTQQLMAEFKTLNRAGKIRAIEYLSFLNDSNDYMKISDKWEENEDVHQSDTPIATSVDDEKPEEE